MAENEPSWSLHFSVIDGWITHSDTKLVDGMSGAIFSLDTVRADSPVIIVLQNGLMKSTKSTVSYAKSLQDDYRQLFTNCD